MSTVVTETASYAVATLDSIDPDHNQDGRARFHLRRHFGVGAFGVAAHRADEVGLQVVTEHTESSAGSRGQEELYLVLSGRATFSLGEEQIDAPAGTFVFVRDPETRRGAVAEEAGTTVLMVAGKAGEAFVRPPAEDWGEMWTLYTAGDYEGAIAELEQALERRPGTAIYLYNLACCESLLGRRKEALEHLAAGLESDPRFRENAREDRDFDSIREDPRFAALVGAE
jgi:tetratricopeptide (TPR) repeat protein